jgi:hypothetical protein
MFDEPMLRLLGNLEPMGCEVPALFACKLYVNASGSWIEFEEDGQNQRDE